ncbi:uncharacterized protein LOC135219222 [Macrobrachium nipponense]|uniref:uncharacterized protein LOC135219222 n=1 Tax=Macrobrachium nipponense TaxID=159736 RepID=UPI0030C8BEDE
MPFSVLDLGADRIPASQLQDCQLKFSIQDVKKNKILKNISDSLKVIFEDGTVLLPMDATTTASNEGNGISYFENDDFINFYGIKLCKTQDSDIRFLQELISSSNIHCFDSHQNIQKSVLSCKNVYSQPPVQSLEIGEASKNMLKEHLAFQEDHTKCYRNMGQSKMQNTEENESKAVFKDQLNENSLEFLDVSSEYLVRKYNEFHLKDQVQFNHYDCHSSFTERNNEFQPLSVSEEIDDPKAVLNIVGKNNDSVPLLTSDGNNVREPLPIFEQNNNVIPNGSKELRLLPVSKLNNDSSFISMPQGNNDSRSLFLSGINSKLLSMSEGNGNSEHVEVNNNLKTMTTSCVNNSEHTSSSMKNIMQTRHDTPDAKYIKEEDDITSIPSSEKSEQDLSSVPVSGLCCDASPHCSCARRTFFIGNEQHQASDDIQEPPHHAQLPELKRMESNTSWEKVVEGSTNSDADVFSNPVKFSPEVQTSSVFATFKNSMEDVNENLVPFLFQTDDKSDFKIQKDNNRQTDVDLRAKNFDLRDLIRQRMSDNDKEGKTTQLKVKSSNEIKEDKFIPVRDCYDYDITHGQVSHSNWNALQREPYVRDNLYEGLGSFAVDEAPTCEKDKSLWSKGEVYGSSSTDVKWSIGNVAEKEHHREKKEWNEFEGDHLTEALSPEIPLVCPVASGSSKTDVKVMMSSVEHGTASIHRDSYTEVDRFNGSEDFIITDEVDGTSYEDDKISIACSGNLKVAELEYVDENLREPVKSYMQPFESSNPLENRDNEDPKWDYLRQLETDDARYQFSRSRWKSLVVPDPNKNCNVFSYLYHKKAQTGVRKTERKRKLGTKEQAEGRPSNKRVCRLNLGFSDRIFDSSMASVRNEYAKHCKRNMYMKRKLEEKLHMLKIAKAEVSVINKFYMGLPDQDLSVSQNVVEQEQIDSKKLFEKFKNIYKWNGRLFVP